MLTTSGICWERTIIVAIKVFAKKKALNKK
jgi:hypothetical protein